MGMKTRMRKFLAIVLALTFSLGMMNVAFADDSVTASTGRTITFHFLNSNNWDQVGAWIYEGVGFVTNVTPSYVYCENHDNGDGTTSKKPLWPGALCEEEDYNWVTVTADFNDLSKGLVIIFNNFVASGEVNDTVQQCDMDALKAANMKFSSDTVTKEQTVNISMSKKSEVVTSGATEVWIECDDIDVTISTSAPDTYYGEKTGWFLKDSNWYYYESNQKIIGWKKIKDVWYYFDEDAIMQIGWQPIDDNWYFFDKSGVMQTGWKKTNGKWYYMNTSGVMTIGWQKIDNKWYYFNATGSMATGWKKLSGKWYYFQSNGKMVSNTTMTIDGKSYTFNASGAMV